MVGTDQTVFAILGPHTGVYYGDVQIVLKPIIKWHPNFFILPHAATFFHESAVNKHTIKFRVWGKTYASPWEPLQKKHYESSKMHHIAPDTSNFLACDLIARVATHKKLGEKDWNEITLSDIKAYWNATDVVDSHHVIEGHLPYQVPLTYIEAVILPESEWNKLSSADQDAATKIFGPRLKKAKDPKEAMKIGAAICEQLDFDSYCGFCFSLEPPRFHGYEVYVPLKLTHSTKNIAFLFLETIVFFCFSFFFSLVFISSLTLLG